MNYWKNQALARSKDEPIRRPILAVIRYNISFAAIDTTATITTDRAHPYGHGKFETLASLIIGVSLIAVAAGIGLKGIDCPLRVNPREENAP